MQFTIRKLLLLTVAAAVASRLLLAANTVHELVLGISISMCCLGFCLILMAGLRVLSETVLAVMLIFAGSWLIIASLPIALFTLTVLLMKILL